MALKAGTRIGPYEVTTLLGVGGMGEVYQATDTRLKREVAIKVLPESVAGDPERLARFQREAEVLAQLNHPRTSPPSTALKTPEPARLWLWNSSRGAPSRTVSPMARFRSKKRSP